MNSDDLDKPNKSQELEFNESDLQSVGIADSDIEQDDKQKASARKKAKKLSKAHRTPAERRKIRIRNRIIITLLAISVVAAIALIPMSRWAVLNFMGFRNTITLTFLEKDTRRPISGVAVLLDDRYEGVTDGFGKVRFTSVTHGKHDISASKAGYSILQTHIVNEIGTSEINPGYLQVIGVKIDITVRDWLSRRAVDGATVSSGESKASTDKKGSVSLVVLPSENPTINITVSASGYRQKKIQIDQNVKSREVTLVSSAKNYFISNRNRRYDIFSSNLDGSAQRRIIQATGKENPQLMQLSIHRRNKKAVLVANRDGLQVDNRIVAGIYVVDLEKATIDKVDEGSDIQLIGWAGDTMAYQKTDHKLKYSHSKLTRLMTLDITTQQPQQIAAANYFSASGISGSKVFYMPTDAYRTLRDAALTSFDTVTSARQTYLEDRPITYLTSPTFGVVEMETEDGEYFELQPATAAVRKIDRQPGANRIFSYSPDQKKTAWADRRDGQGVLVVRQNDGKERTVLRLGGMVEPVRFITNSLVVVRVATTNETADYVVHTATGKFAKIVDVVNVGQLWNER